MVGYNAFVPFVGTRPRFRPVRRTALAVPVTLAEDPQGIGSSRIHVSRRLRIISSTPDSIEVVAQQVTQHRPALISYPVGGGTPERVPPEPMSFRQLGDARSVRLADGAVERIGGLRFRIARAASGWTLTPLDPSFPAWLDYRCGGTQVVSVTIPL